MHGRGGPGRGTVVAMTWTRRRVLVKAAKVVAAAPLLEFVACTDDGADMGETVGQTSGASTSTSTSGSGPSTATGGSGSATGSSSTGGDGSSSGGEGTSTGAEDSSSSTGSQSESSSTGAAVCEPTPEDIEGPFYRPNIPVGSNLDVHGDDGIALRIEGRVLADDCAPIADAVVEIWHATPRMPDGEPGDADATYDDTAAYRYYGQVATDADGRYAFTTLRPGWYLNGPQYRPAHVHVKVWVRGVERLTSQLYFEGDPFNAEDPWFNPVMALAPDDEGVATIDLVV